MGEYQLWRSLPEDRLPDPADPEWDRKQWHPRVTDQMEAIGYTMVALAGQLRAADTETCTSEDRTALDKEVSQLMNVFGELYKSLILFRDIMAGNMDVATFEDDGESFTLGGPPGELEQMIPVVKNFRQFEPEVVIHLIERMMDHRIKTALQEAESLDDLLTALGLPGEQIKAKLVERIMAGDQPVPMQYL